jgi:hypothetical protein
VSTEEYVRQMSDKRTENALAMHEAVWRKLLTRWLEGGPEHLAAKVREELVAEPLHLFGREQDDDGRTVEHCRHCDLSWVCPDCNGKPTVGVEAQAAAVSPPTTTPPTLHPPGSILAGWPIELPDEDFAEYQIRCGQLETAGLWEMPSVTRPSIAPPEYLAPNGRRS